MLSFEKKLDHLTAGSIVMIGIPDDHNSTFMRGPALAPPLIRETLFSGSSNLFSESGIGLAGHSRFHDFGDLDTGEWPEAFTKINTHVKHFLQRDAFVFTLGGDHAITYPIIDAYAGKYPALNILHFDAHPDLYDNFNNNPYSHASPFARIMESRLAKRLVQIGIRTLNDHQRKQVKRFDVEVIEMQHFSPHIELEFEGPVYLSLDMDSLDPAFAPGVSHHEPGGLSTRDIIHLIHKIRAPIVGADIVEYNPKRDLSNMTAMVAAKLLKEISAQMLLTNSC